MDGVLESVCLLLCVLQKSRDTPRGNCVQYCHVQARGSLTSLVPKEKKVQPAIRYLVEFHSRL